MVKKLVIQALVILITLLSLWGDEPVIATGKVKVQGLSLSVSPAIQQVPVNTDTIVNTTLGVKDQGVIKGMLVKGELRGPGLNKPMVLTTLPDQPFQIPGLLTKGDYFLENIRVERDGKLLFKGKPESVQITVMDLVVSRVETRPLTLKEIREKGIVITDENFTVYNFSVGMAIESQKVNFDFPIIYNKITKEPQVVSYSDLNIPDNPNKPAQTIPVSIKIPKPSKPTKPDNSGAGGDSDDGKVFGMLMFNNDVAFLNQFFSVMLIVSNTAPDGSPIELKDMEATITFPEEGLREAKTDPPHIKGTPIPVKWPGPDGKLGTSDDATIILATFSGMAEFLAEGLKEGTHYVTIDFKGKLGGLPGGDKPLEGTASGAVVVKNPEYSVTFAHPSVIRENELYDILMTVTNISPVPANLVSVRLPASRMSGTKLLSEETFKWDTILPGESRTATFKMQSLKTGKVVATAFEAETGVKGQFVLTAGVGEKDIPLSPDTLIFPDYAYSLPQDIVNSSMMLMGEAWSIATVPAGGLPEGLPVIRRSEVNRRIIDLADAGRSATFGEKKVNYLSSLMLDWQGNQLELENFDRLRLLTTKGWKFADAVAGYFSKYLKDNSEEAFIDRVSIANGWRKPFIMVLHERSDNSIIKMEDFYRNELYMEESKRVREIPSAELFHMENHDFMVVGKPSERGYKLKVEGRGEGDTSLTVIVPALPSGFKKLVFNSIPVKDGSEAVVEISETDTSYTLKVDTNGDGTYDSQINPVITDVPQEPLRVVGAMQELAADEDGQVFAILFNRTLDEESAVLNSNYHIENQNIRGICLQPNKRVVAGATDFVISPFIDSFIEINGVKDSLGRGMADSGKIRIIPTIKEPGGFLKGSIYRPDGTKIVKGFVTIEEDSFRNRDGFGSAIPEYVLSVAPIIDGEFTIKYVRMYGGNFGLYYYDPETTKVARLRSSIRIHGEEKRVSLTLMGQGSVKVKVVDKNGNPITGARVDLEVEFDDSLQPDEGKIVQEFKNPIKANLYYNYSDENGEILFDQIPVGRMRIDGRKGDFFGSTNAAIGNHGEEASARLLLQSGDTGTVKGRVLDNDRSTPVQTYVGIEYHVPGTNEIYGTFWLETDENGYFEKEGVPIGRVKLWALTPGGGKYDVGAQVVITLGADAIKDETLIFRGAGRVEGKVLLYDGTPLEGAYLRINNVYTGKQSGADGSYSLDIPLLYHNSQTTISAEKEIEITADKKREMVTSITVPLYYENQVINKNIVFEDHRTGGIRGTVYSVDGSPAEGRIVKFCDGNYTVFDTIAKTDSEGKFLLENVPPGSYIVYSLSEGSAATTNVTVKGGNDYPDISMKYRGKGTAKINVLNHNNSSGVMADIQFGRIVFKEEPGKNIGFDYESETLTTDENGNLTLSNLFLGNYTFKAINPFYPDVRSYLKLTSNGETKNLTINMNRLGKLKIKVLSPEGSPQGGVGIKLKKRGYDELLLFTLTEPDTNSGLEIGENMFELISAGGFEIVAKDDVTGYQGNVFGAMDQVRMEQGLPTEVEISLKYTGIVEGQVKTSAGLPAGRAKITYESIGFPYEKRELDTDDEGNYTLNGILEGDYSISAFQTGTNLKGKAKGSLSGKGATVVTDVLFGPVGTVKGRVLLPDSENSVVPNCQVVLQTSKEKDYAYSNTDENGVFEIDTIPNGNYKLVAFNPASGRKGKVSVEIKTEGETLYRDIFLEKRGTVEGTFYDGSGTIPIAGAKVLLHSQGLFNYQVRINSDDQGKFRFQQVGEGKFTITAEEPVNELRGSATGEIKIEGELLNIDVVCEETGTVTGTVYKSDKTTPEDEATLKIHGVNRIYSTTSGVDGTYIFKNVQVGKFTVAATEKQGKDSGLTEGILRFHGDEAVADIVFTGFGKVSGTVTDGGGSPAEGVELKIQSPDNHELPTETRTTDGNGNFLFDKVRPGNYRITGTTAGGLGTSGEFTIAGPGDEQQIDLQLEDAGSIIGRILLEDGVTPASGAYVTVKYGNRESFIIAEPDGTFTISPVLKGNFTVKIEGRDGTGRQISKGTITTNGEEVNTGDLLLDRVLPQMVSSEPVSGASGVSLNSGIKVLFSEPMMPSSVNTGNVRLNSSEGRVNGTVNLNSEGTELTFIPSTTLKSLIPYTLLMENLTDRAGNKTAAPVSVSFTTLDNLPPVVVNSTPENGATAVDTGVVIKVNFNEVISNQSVNQSTVSLLKGSTPTGGTVSISSDGKGVVFTPSSALATDSVYTVKVASLQDIAGNSSVNWTSTFTTPDTIRPVITMNPPSGGTSVIEQSIFKMEVNTSTPGDVARVHFFVNGIVQATDSTSPYEGHLRAPEIGDETSFLVEAVAEDGAGNFSNRVQIVFNLLPDAPPTATFENLSTTELLPGENFSVTLKAVDDAEIKYAKFSAKGSTLNYIQEGPVSGKEWSRTYHISVPQDMELGSKIDITGEVTDIKGHKVAASPLVVNIKDDQQAPVVTITSPEEGSQFNHKDVVEIKATATDDVGIKEIQFWIDDTHLGTDETSPYDIDYTVPPLDEDKDIVIKAVAVDDAGKETETTVTVKLLKLFDETAPKVKILSPSEGEHIFPGEKLKLKASVTDDEGVSTVEFKVNGTSVHTATVEPYEFVYTVPESAKTGDLYEVEVIGTDLDNKKTSKKQSAIVIEGQFIPDGTVINEGDTTYKDKIVIVKEGTVTINGNHSFTHLLVKEEASVTHNPATTTEVWSMNLNITGQLTVGVDGKVTATAKGYRPGRTFGNVTEGASHIYSGASHGGMGGQEDHYFVGKTYGSIYRPATHGSGSGVNSGNPGGGVIHIKVAKLLNSGSIESNGLGGSPIGGGAGGSILLEVEKINGTGRISANGGDGINGRPGGGGGRVAVYYTNLSPEQDVTAYGGKEDDGGSNPAGNGGAGTVYLKQSSEEKGQLVIDNNGFESTQGNVVPEGKAGTITAVSGSIVTDSAAQFTGNELKGMFLEVNGVRYTIISNTDKQMELDPAGQSMPQVGDSYSIVENTELVVEGFSKTSGSIHYGEITVDGGILVADSLLKADSITLINGGVITHSPATTTEVFTLSIDAKEISIDGTSKISSTAKGYKSGRTLGNVTEGASHIYSGASHGGMGGKEGSYYYVGKTYGSIYRPVNHGSGSGYHKNNAGGGVIYIKSSELVNNGSIEANGYGGSANGGGAGGSVLLEVKDVRGTGKISANGGDAINGRPGGGGGRVALYYDSLSAEQKVTAYGGKEDDGGINPSGNGSVGTVYLKKNSEDKGQIVIDNNGFDSVKGHNFSIPEKGVIEAVNGGTITDTTADFTTNLEGIYLLVNGFKYRIISNTKTEIVVDTTGNPAIPVNGEYRFYLDSEIVVSNTLLIADTPLDMWKLTLEKGGIVTHSLCTRDKVYNLSLTAGTVNIDAVSKISATAKGYLPGRTLGNVTEGASHIYSGASHGGMGGKERSYYVGKTYGSIYKPVTHGSGSGVNSGNRGGGVIYLKATEMLNNGSVEANGNGGSAIGGGAGGSVLLEVKNINGTGKISANGGDAIDGRPGGGGGRIAVYYDNLSPEQKITAFGGKEDDGVSNPAGNGGAGTVYLKKSDGADNRILISNGGVKSGTPYILESSATGTITEVTGTVVKDGAADFTIDEFEGMELEVTGKRYKILSNTDKELTLDPEEQDMPKVGDKYLIRTPSDLVIDGADAKITGTFSGKSITVEEGTLTVDGTLKGDSVKVKSNGVITHSEATAEDLYSLTIEAVNLTVEPEGKISVAGKGYIKGRTIGNVTDGGASPSDGASHGGRGGSEIGGSEIYGSLYWPVNHGAGSGYSQNNAGGGVLHLKAENLLLKGTIESTGRGGNNDAAGAGGSLLVEAKTITGTGKISADGGNSNSSSAGGGGRVAIYYDTMVPEVSVTAYGGLRGDGNNNPDHNGGAGTVFLKLNSDQLGTFIVDNRDMPSSMESTPIPSIGTQLSATIGEYTVFVGDAGWKPAAFTGMFVNPDINSNKIFRITGNTEDTINTDPADGKVSDSANAGAEMIGVHRFKNLYIKGGTHVVTYDRVEVTDVDEVNGVFTAANRTNDEPQ